MTKKDYELIAKVLKMGLPFGFNAIDEKQYASMDISDKEKTMNIRALMFEFIHELKIDNPRFDEIKFKEAIGFVE